MYIMAIDPGGTTGIATCAKGGQYNFHQFGADPQHDRFITMDKLIRGYSETASDFGDEFIVVCERFEWRKDEEAEERTKIDYTACELVGAIKLITSTLNVPLVMQSASQVVGKTAFWGKGSGDAKIKKLGLWRPGQRHAMDALRHLLYYRAFTMCDESILERLR